MDSKSLIFTEVFPVQLESLPQLSAYKLDVVGGDISTIGGKLSYRLRRKFPGHWVWIDYRIVTDCPQERDGIMNLVEELWQEDPTVYKSLRGIELDTHWRSSPQAQGQFVARGLFSDIHSDIQRELTGETRSLGNAYVERVYDARGWVVANQPAVSISISSRMVYKEDLRVYASRISDAQNLIGLWVADKTSTLKGEIVGISGKMIQHRRRLLALTQREEMQEIIQKASDDELVVSVLAGRNEYDYHVVFSDTNHAE